LSVVETPPLYPLSLHGRSSDLLALLQVSGRPPKVDQEVIDTIKKIEGEYHFETFVSLSCHNCPEVVQALNVMSVLNPNITHTMRSEEHTSELQLRENLVCRLLL